MNSRRKNLAFFAATMLISMAGCGIVKDKYKLGFKNPKNGLPAEDGNEVVTGEQTETGVRAKVHGPNLRGQIVNGPAGTALSDASITFPPGSLAIDIDVSMEAGQDLSGDQELLDRGLDGSVVSQSASVNVTSTPPTALLSPFVLALPHPGKSELLMQGTGTIIVLYDVTRVSDGVRVRSYFKREDLKVNDKDIRISSRHFGAYQAVYFEPAKAKPAVIARPVLFQPGMTILSFGGSRARVNYFSGWGTFLAPFKVEAGDVLATGLITRAILP